MRRSPVREVRLLAAVFILPVTLALAFPREAFLFRGSAPRPGRAVAAFVTLDAKTLNQALRAARSAWQYDTHAAHSDNMRFSLDRLPDVPVRPMATVTPLAPAAPEAVDYPFGPLRPSRRAAPPTALASEPPRTKPPSFSRADLLSFGNP